MPKPMLKQFQKQSQSSGILSAAQSQQKQKPQLMSKMELDRLLRKPRSKEYMKAFHKLDAGGRVNNQKQVNEIMDAIRNEFPEVEISGALSGCVSICYLGKPYEVHTLDLANRIIKHFKVGESLPNGLEKARSIALSGNYDLIEVYVDCCRCISSNGDVSVVSI